jgi:hypothetical protein
MISTAIKISQNGNFLISLENKGSLVSDICVSTRTSLPFETTENGNFASLASLLPEFSFEFDIFKSMGFFEDSLYFTYKNSILELHFKVKCDSAQGFILRSEPDEARLRRTEKAISYAIRKIKIMLSKK